MQFKNACNPPLQIGGPKPPFWTTSQPATLTAYIFGMKHGDGIHKCTGKCIANYKGSPTSSQNNILWSTNSFKLEVSFHQPSVNSAFHFIARLRRRRSANGTQPNFAKRWTVNRANNLPYKSWGRPSRKNWGQKIFTIVRFLDNFET